MTLDQLKVFVAVAQRLHVTKAARDLDLTQSAASASIAALEGSVGLRLFDRIGRNIQLTSAGQQFLPEAKEVLARAERAGAMLAELSGLKRGHLRLHASQTIANYWLPPHLHRFHELHPGIRLELAIGNTSQVAAAVLGSEADLGFVEGEVEAEILARIPVPGDQLVMVVAPSHRFAFTAALDAAELARTPWVLRERGSGTRQIFETAVRAHGIEPGDLEVALELPSNEAVRSAVEAGAGATVISHLATDRALRAGTLAPVGLTFPSRNFWAIRHGDRHRGKAEEALLALVRSAPTQPGVTAVVPQGGRKWHAAHDG